MVLEQGEREGVAWGGVWGSERDDATEDLLPCTTFPSDSSNRIGNERMLASTDPDAVQAMAHRLTICQISRQSKRFWWHEHGPL